MKTLVTALVVSGLMVGGLTACQQELDDDIKRATQQIENDLYEDDDDHLDDFFKKSKKKTKRSKTYRTKRKSSFRSKSRSFRSSRRR
tara:strand:- start:299 stop:559 length:261 start_codon:yes stop_codon:yes gene_type:complete